MESKPIRNWGAEAPLVALLGGAALILGGGGSPAPFPEMVLQCLAIAVVAIWVVLTRRDFPFFPAHRKVWMIGGLVLLLPIVQLLPLPPALWQSMAGRELMQSTLALVGAENSWRPWSMTPDLTLAGLLALLPAVLFMIMTASLRRGGRATVVAVMASVAGLSLLAGAVQLAGGEANTFRFYQADVGFLNGFQANHNAQADVLLIAMVAVAATIREYAEFHPLSRMTERFRFWLTLGSTLVLSLCIVLTASRVGIALLPVAWIGVLAIVWPMVSFDRRKFAIFGAVAVLLVIIGLGLASRAHIIERVMARFDFQGELRPQIWHDTLYVIRQYFPWGSGIGSFVPVFIAAEPLEVIDPTLTNRAHNDYLELLVEGGIFGVGILAAIVWNLAALIRKAWIKAPAGSRSQVVFSISALAVIALHSIVDYPLRTMSLAFIAAAAAALLMPLPSGADTRNADA